MKQIDCQYDTQKSISIRKQPDSQYATQKSISIRKQLTVNIVTYAGLRAL
jgi:hypothetical protein